MARDLILICRPQPQAGAFANILEDKGFRTFVEPMLSLHPVNFSVPERHRFQNLIFTSANGVRFFMEAAEGAADFLKHTAYCVGENTADLAATYGFENIRVAGGDAKSLVRKIIQGDPGLRRDDKKGKSESDGKTAGRHDEYRYLHVRGRDVAVDVARVLKEQDIDCACLVVYQADFVEALSENFISTLKAGRLEAAVFFSRRTAENFMRLIINKGLQDHLLQIKVLCISEAVLEYVQPDWWHNAYTADMPNRQGMLTSICRILKQPACGC